MSKKGFIIPMVAALILAPTGAATYYGINYTNLQEEQKTTNTEADSLKQGMAELLAQKEELVEKLASMTEENEANKALVAQAQAEYEQVSAQIDLLNEQISALEDTNEENALQIALLEEQKLAATNEVTRLNAIMPYYDELQEGVCKVAIFYVDGVNVKTVVCNRGDSITDIPTEYDTWRADDGCTYYSDDLSTRFNIDEDIAFYAVL